VLPLLRRLLPREALAQTLVSWEQLSLFDLADEPHRLRGEEQLAIEPLEGEQPAGRPDTASVRATPDPIYFVPPNARARVRARVGHRRHLSITDLRPCGSKAASR
jgi:hypothetical protein